MALTVKIIWAHVTWLYKDKIAHYNVFSHTVQATITPGTTKRVPVTVSGGGLHGTYTCAQLHFHWGADNTKGSEHAFDGDYGSLEVCC